MKRILWCGGSHMGNFRSAVRSFEDCGNQVNKYHNDFFPTAAGDLWSWYQRGGRLKISNGRASFRNSPDLFSPEGEPLYGNSFDLNSYDAIIFVGQWLRPLQYLGMTDWFRSNPKQSSPLLRALTKDIISNPFIPGSGLHQIPNEPLTLLPSKLKDKSRLILIPDPLPGRPIDAEQAMRPANYREQYDIYQKNLDFVEVFFESIQDLCRENGMQYCFQPESTFDKGSWTTHSSYMAFPDERIHVNPQFYSALLKEKVCPLIEGMPER